jgi:hypothetical protein
VLKAVQVDLFHLPFLYNWENFPIFTQTLAINNPMFKTNCFVFKFYITIADLNQNLEQIS